MQVRLGGGTGKTSVTTGRSSRPVSRTPRALGSPTPADVLAYSSKSGEYRRICGRTYVVAQLSKASIWGIPTSVSYFTRAGRLSALRSMITRYSSHIALAIASRNTARCPLAPGWSGSAARKRRHPWKSMMRSPSPSQLSGLTRRSREGHRRRQLRLRKLLPHLRGQSHRRVGEARRGCRGGTPSDTGVWRQAWRDSGAAENVNGIPVAGLVPWAFSPRTSSVRTPLVTGIVALSRRRRCPG